MDLSSSKDRRDGKVEVQESESCSEGQTTDQTAGGCINEPIKTGLSEKGPGEPVDAEDDQT
jgi:hypothetical protein